MLFRFLIFLLLFGIRISSANESTYQSLKELTSHPPELVCAVFNKKSSSSPDPQFLSYGLAPYSWKLRGYFRSNLNNIPKGQSEYRIDGIKVVIDKEEDDHLKIVFFDPAFHNSPFEILLNEFGSSGAVDHTNTSYPEYYCELSSHGLGTVPSLVSREEPVEIDQNHLLVLVHHLDYFDPKHFTKNKATEIAKRFLEEKKSIIGLIGRDQNFFLDIDFATHWLFEGSSGLFRSKLTTPSSEFWVTLTGGYFTGCQQRALASLLYDAEKNSNIKTFIARIPLEATFENFSSGDILYNEDTFSLSERQSSYPKEFEKEISSYLNGFEKWGQERSFKLKEFKTNINSNDLLGPYLEFIFIRK
ncbi:MAG: hypothetical protein HY390_05630 [Deltaproteobacteria bacterium]|nr:hypothetical protein [Deltaproteobacteria bacterium]